MQWQNQFHFIDRCNPSHYKTRTNKSSNCCRSHTYLFLVFLVHSLSWFLRNKVKLPASRRYLPCLYNRKTQVLAFYTLLKPEPFFTYKMHRFCCRIPIREVKVIATTYRVRQYLLKAILQSTTLMTWQSCDNEGISSNLPFLKEIKSPKQGFIFINQIFQSYSHSAMSLQYYCTNKAHISECWTLKVNSSNFRRATFYRELQYLHCFFTDKSIHLLRLSIKCCIFVHCPGNCGSSLLSEFSHWITFSTIKLFFRLLLEVCFHAFQKEHQPCQNTYSLLFLLLTTRDEQKPIYRRFKRIRPTNAAYCGFTLIVHMPFSV